MATTGSVTSSTTPPVTTTPSTSSTSSTSNSGSTSSGSPLSGNVTNVSSNSSAGAAGGSVINVSTLVSELVAASEAPQQAIIANQTEAVTANISALGTLKSALSTFQSSLTALATPSAFNSVTANSSSQDVVTATAGSNAVAGSYNVTVSSLASGQQLLSGAFGASADIGTGTLSLSVGGQSFSVNISSADDTLSGIANAINGASSNTGITATVIQGTDGAHLLLSSANTGATNTITVGETDGGTALAALTYGSGNTSHFTQQTPAADASFSVAGVPYTSPSNSVSTAISGVTINLAGLTAGAAGAPTDAPASATVTVANDSSTVQQNIDSFVSAYNTLQGTLAQLGSYDASTGTAGQFLGNPVLTNIQSGVQRALYSLVGSSNYNSLASIGITTNSDGSLSVNDATLQNVLSSNFSAVSQLFSSTNGVAAQLNSGITADLAGGGTISTYSQTLTSQENALTQQTATLNNQMSQLQASLTQQYATLNTLLSSLQSTSSYLTQAFASLPTVQGTPNA